MNQKGLSGIVVLIAVLLIAVAVGAYYMSMMGNKSQVNIPTTTKSPAENNTTSSSNITLTTQSFQLQKSTAVSDDETINITMQIPSDWTFQKIERSSNDNVLIKNCADYWATSNSQTRLIISPVCTGWSATYTPWPSDAVQVKGQTVRYFDQKNGKYIYTDGDKSSNQVQDAVLVMYGNKFVPFHITLSSKNDSDINLADQIVSSLKASVQ